MYTNIKSFDGKITIYFKNNSGKEKTLNNIDSHCICLLKIVLDSVYKMKNDDGGDDDDDDDDDKCYPQIHQRPDQAHQRKISNPL